MNQSQMSNINKLINSKVFRKHREIILLAVDLSMVLVAYFLSRLLRVDLDVGLALSDGKMILWFLPAACIVHTITFYLFNIPKSLWKYFGLSEVKNIVFANLLSAFIISTYIFAVYNRISLIVVVIMAELIATMLIFASRFLYRAYRESMYGTNELLDNALIIGAGDGGYLLEKELSKERHIERAKAIGFIDDYRSKNIISGLKVLGKVSDIPRIVEEYDVKKIYIAMPSVEIKYQREVFEVCQNLNVTTKIMKKSQQRINLVKDELKYPLEDVSINDLLGRGAVDLNTDEISSYVCGKVVMVTGAAGSIGSELCRQIMEFNPSSLIMLDINENALYMLEHEIRRNFNFSIQTNSIKIYSYIASVREYDEIYELIGKREPDLVYHAAAHKHVPLMETRPQEAFKNNVLGTRNVIEACIANKTPRFVLISTDKAVNPTNVMGATKRLCEMILQANSNNGVTKLGAVRFGNVLGSNGSVIPIFNEQIKSGGPITLTHRDIIRYFMTIPEAAKLVMQAGYYANKGEIFVLDMGEPVKIYDLALNLIKLSGYEPFKDIDIVEVGLRPGEKMYEELSLSGEVTSKTSNESIFVNEVQDINKIELYNAIDKINELVINHVKRKELREKILDLIK